MARKSNSGKMCQMTRLRCKRGFWTILFYELLVLIDRFKRMSGLALGTLTMCLSPWSECAPTACRRECKFLKCGLANSYYRHTLRVNKLLMKSASIPRISFESCVQQWLSLRPADS